VRRALQIAVSLICAGIIFFGARYALGRERLRQTDLQTVYQQINQESFNGELTDATVGWSSLPDNYGTTVFYSDESAEIEIDRGSITSEEQLRLVLSHEMCHIATRDEVAKTGQGAHGAAFQACMARFK
jgi:predicted SprT family Zn-dependent metalloprotease